MTKKSLAKAKEELYNIYSNLSMRDFLQVNYKSGNKSKKHIPYSLSQDTIESLEIYKIACKDEITQIEEEKIKGYLLPIRILRSHLLKIQDFEVICKNNFKIIE